MFWLTDAAAAEMTFGWTAGDRSAWHWREQGTVGGHAITLDESWRETVVSVDKTGATVSLELEALAVTLDGNRALSLTDIPVALRTLEVRFDRRGLPTAAVVPVAYLDGSRLVLARRDAAVTAILAVDPTTGRAGPVAKDWAYAGEAEIEIVPMSWWSAGALPSGDLMVGVRQDRAGIRTTVESIRDAVAVLRLSPTPVKPRDPDAFEMEGAKTIPPEPMPVDVVDVDLEQRLDFVRLQRLRLEGKLARSFVGGAGFVTFAAHGTLERLP